MQEVSEAPGYVLSTTVRRKNYDFLGDRGGGGEGDGGDDYGGGWGKKGLRIFRILVAGM